MSLAPYYYRPLTPPEASGAAGQRGHARNLSTSSYCTVDTSPDSSAAWPNIASEDQDSGFVEGLSFNPSPIDAPTNLVLHQQHQTCPPSDVQECDGARRMYSDDVSSIQCSSFPIELGDALAYHLQSTTQRTDKDTFSVNLGLEH
ncbi:hypothetical protein LTR47_001789 [Exophiala xenobiotica]|nr:hypothetical protein LTR47_001789 [Exophiala xenobiotica]